jgi:hypothetical protein
MAKRTETVYVDTAGKVVLRSCGREGKNWSMEGIYGQINAADARRLHAALSELLIDLADRGEADQKTLECQIPPF